MEKKSPSQYFLICRSKKLSMRPRNFYLILLIIKSHDSCMPRAWGGAGYEVEGFNPF